MAASGFVFQKGFMWRVGDEGLGREITGCLLPYPPVPSPLRYGNRAMILISTKAPGNANSVIPIAVQAE